jgi:hypothetical protein
MSGYGTESSGYSSLTSDSEQVVQPLTRKRYATNTEQNKKYKPNDDDSSDSTSSFPKSVQSSKSAVTASTASTSSFPKSVQSSKSAVTASTASTSSYPSKGGRTTRYRKKSRRGGKSKKNNKSKRRRHRK